LRFNPVTDLIKTADGRSIKLTPPSAPELPSKGYEAGTAGFLAPLPVNDRQKTTIIVKPTSERLQLLEPFPTWDGKDLEKLPVLIKAKGQCTTDHISPAGKWLVYRGHLDKISDNMFLGADNTFTTTPGTGVDQLDGQIKPIAAIARHYKSKGLGWVAVGEVNYGEGSSREHAAMSPRFLGGRAVLVKSFARLHETNLKKQGILPLTFNDASDYHLIKVDDRLSIVGLSGLAPGQPVTIKIHHADGGVETIKANHSLTDEQVRWFKAGSALNLLRTQQAGG
jgi:aconitate hydratase